MRPIRTTRQFERDLKRARRRGKDLDKLSLSSFAT
jgi:mRNA-degrading endonuclease YafQ of YafQ-DinJ toxin-antitoxin module